MHLCLVALNAYPAIEPQVAGPIGGIETRSWLLARGLAQQPGVQVDFVIRHHAPPRQAQYAGVRLVPLVDPLYPHWQTLGHALERRSGFPWVRLKRFDPQLLWLIPRLALDRLRRGRVYSSDRPDSRLVDLRADVYGTFGVQTHSDVVIRSAHAIGRPAVLFLGSDGDLDPIFEPQGNGVDPYGTRAEVGRHILAAADVVIAQTAEQQQRLKTVFGRESHLLPNPIDLEEWDRRRSAPCELEELHNLNRYVLWVGRAEDVHKRPQLCLDMARRIPGVPFLMVLNPRDAAVEARIRAEAPSNVRIIERVPVPQMPAVFASAAAFLSTSQLEGFPNVFLQAAVSGVPIVSLEVGREFLTRSRSGVCTAGDAGLAAQILQACWERLPSQDFDAESARAYVREHHDRTRQAPRLLNWLRSAANSSAGPG